MSSGGPPVDELVSRPERDGDPGSRPSWLIRGLVAVVVVAAAVAVGPKLLSSPHEKADEQPPGPTSSPTRGAGTSAPTPSSVHPSPVQWKIRGDLAGDTAFLAAVEQRAQHFADAADLQPLYAATLPDGGRLALLAGASGDDPVDAPGDGFIGVPVLAVHVPAGAQVDASRVTASGGIPGPDDIAGWAGHGTGGRVFLVVLARPSPLDVEVSRRIDYYRDGTATREWRPVRGRNGSAIVELRGKVDPMVVIRTAPSADAAQTMPVMLTVDGDPTRTDLGQATAAIHVDGLSAPDYRGPQRSAVPRLLVSAFYGLLDPAVARGRVLWSGVVGDQKLALVRVRRPDGVAFQTVVGENSGGDSSTAGARRVVQDEADAAPWLLTSDQLGLPGAPSPLMLIVPSGLGQVVIRLATDDQEVRRRVGALGLVNLGDAQTATADKFFGSTVTVLDRSGHRVARVTLVDTGDDPFLLAQ